MKEQLKKQITLLRLQILGGLFFTFLFFIYEFQVDTNALNWDYFLVYNNFFTVFLIVFPIFWMPTPKARKVYFGVLLILTFFQSAYFSYYKGHFGSFQIWYFFIYFTEIFTILSTSILMVQTAYFLLIAIVFFSFFVIVEKKYRFVFFKFSFLPYAASHEIKNNPYFKILEQDILFPPELGSKIISDILGYQQSLVFPDTYTAVLGLNNPIGLDGFWEIEVEKEQIKNATYKAKYTDLNLEFSENKNGLTTN